MKVKKLLSIILVLSMILINGINVSANDVSVYVDNELIQLTDADGYAVYPFIQNGTTYVPLRGISEALDCTVKWDGYNKTVLIYKEIQDDNSVFRNSDDEIKLYVDNQRVELKDANGTVVKPFIKDGTTYVPLRGVSQALGCWVRWNGQTKTVSVYMNTIPPDGVTLSENKPYETYYTDEYHELQAEKIKLDGVDYTNALQCWDVGVNWGNSWSAYALFNLNSLFDKMTCKIGHTEDFDKEKEINFVVDGKIVKTHIIKANSPAQEIEVDLNKGLQLKIVAGLDEDGIGHNGIGLGNIIFWGE